MALVNVGKIFCRSRIVDPHKVVSTAYKHMGIARNLVGARQSAFRDYNPSFADLVQILIRNGDEGEKPDICSERRNR